MTVIRTKSGIAGEYKIEAVRLDADGNEISRRVAADWFPNLITDQGLEQMGANTEYMLYCQVGTGNTTPAFTDTQLATYLAGAVMDGSVTQSIHSAETPPYNSIEITYRFAAGVATGNLAEVGVGWAISGTTLYSRALILDSGGLPTTITILADEVLDVTYSCRIYPPTVDTGGIVTIAGVDYSYVHRAASIAEGTNRFTGGWNLGFSSGGVTDAGRAAVLAEGLFHAGSIGAVTTEPSGVTAEMSVASAEYSPGSLTRSGTMTGGIDVFLSGEVPAKSISYKWAWAAYQVEFTPGIPKTSGNTFTLTVEHTWARHTVT